MIKVNSREGFLMEVKKYLPMNCNAIEIGVLHGDFSDAILKLIQPGRLILVDPYIFSNETYGSEMNYLTTAYSTSDDYAGLLKRFAHEIADGAITVIRDYSYNEVSEILNNSLDFVYVDSSHLYQDAKRDLTDWLPKLKQDGLMCGHDYIKFDGFGVMQAVDEFCKENNFEIIILNENGGDFALRVIQ